LQTLISTIEPEANQKPSIEFSEACDKSDKLQKEIAISDIFFTTNPH
jgi:hypothetical protein